MFRPARERYNQSFTEKKYKSFLAGMNAEFNYEIPFRVAESPVFVPKNFSQSVFGACDEIISFLNQKDFMRTSEKAVPASLNVPGETKHPLFLALDFGVCKNAEGEIIPQLIEMQGFASMFGWQHFVAQQYRKHFTIPENFSHLFVPSPEDYIFILKKNILKNHNPENVILLEVEPEKQNTRIDFLISEKWLGIKAVCISKIIKQGRHIFYESDGKKIPIHRIYNRVIFDELLKRDDLKLNFRMTDDVNVEWADHPNWFFRISKYLMPRIKSKFIPECFFVNELKSIPPDLENYVLKPLYSFSGSGIKFHVKKDDIESIPDPENFILQKKVNYEPVLQSPDGNVKVELRILFIREPGADDFMPVINMARLSRGEMIGVKYNLNKTWVGGSVGFYEK